MATTSQLSQELLQFTLHDSESAAVQDRQSYASLNVHIRIARLFQRRTLNLAEQANREHRQILSAFEDRDVQIVTERVASHIRSVQDRLRTVLSSGDEVGEKFT